MVDEAANNGDEIKTNANDNKQKQNTQSAVQQRIRM